MERRVPLEKLTVTQLVKNSAPFYRNPRSIAVFTFRNKLVYMDLYLTCSFLYAPTCSNVTHVLPFPNFDEQFNQLIHHSTRICISGFNTHDRPTCISLYTQRLSLYQYPVCLSVCLSAHIRQFSFSGSYVQHLHAGIWNSGYAQYAPDKVSLLEHSTRMKRYFHVTCQWRAWVYNVCNIMK
jgi:hypothetical protein